MPLDHPHHSRVLKHLAPAKSSPVLPTHAALTCGSTEWIPWSLPGRGGGAVVWQRFRVRRCLWRGWELLKLKEATAGGFGYIKVYDENTEAVCTL